MKFAVVHDVRAHKIIYTTTTMMMMMLIIIIIIIIMPIDRSTQKQGLMQ